MHLAPRDASLNGETHSSARGIEWSRKTSKLRDKWFCVVWVLRVGGKPSLGELNKAIRMSTECLPLVGLSHTTGDSDGLSPPVTIKEAIALLGRRMWEQITGQESH